MSKKHPILGKVMDPQWKNGRKLVFHNLFTPTWKQRFQILFGQNVFISSKVHTEHSPGRCATGCFPRITTAIRADDPQLKLLTQIEDTQAEIAQLPSGEQYAAAEKMSEEYNRLMKGMPKRS